MEMTFIKKHRSGCFYTLFHIILSMTLESFLLLLFVLFQLNKYLSVSSVYQKYKS